MRVTVFVLFVFEVTSLWHMSIRARIVVAIAFEKIDHAPYAEASAQRHNQRLKRRNRRSEKCHNRFLHVFVVW